MLANWRTDCQSLAFQFKHKTVVNRPFGHHVATVKMKVYNYFYNGKKQITKKRIFPSDEVVNLTRFFNNSIKHTCQDFGLAFRQWILFGNAIEPTCDWGKSTLMSTKSSCHFEPRHLKSLYSNWKSCQRNWIIWTWEPNECFSPARVTERPAASQWRVLCEAIDCKPQLNMKSHPHILLKPAHAWE